MIVRFIDDINHNVYRIYVYVYIIQLLIVEHDINYYLLLVPRYYIILWYTDYRVKTQIKDYLQLLNKK